MEWLRWILLAVGAVVLIGIVVLYFRHRSEQAVVLGQGPESDRDDPIDAQLRAGHTIGDGSSRERGDATQAEPFIDGVGKARTVHRDTPEPLADQADEMGELEAPSGSAGPSLFRQRQTDESDLAAMGDAEAAPDASVLQTDLFAERHDEGLLGMSTDELMHDVLHEEPDADEADEVESDVETESDQQPVVLSLLLAHPQGDAFNGLKVQQLIEEIGFTFGEFSIYHFSGEDGSPWFSLMNGLKPGTFDPNDVDSFHTPVLALFMQLPVPGAEGELVFERMLEVARDLADQLGADLLDDHREPMSADSIDRYREQLIFF